jgi:hypothetical protein
MVCINNNESEEKKIDPGRYEEILGMYKSATEIITGKSFTDFTNLIIPAKTAMIFELRK